MTWKTLLYFVVAAQAISHALQEDFADEISYCCPLTSTKESNFTRLQRFNGKDDTIYCDYGVENPCVYKGLQFIEGDKLCRDKPISTKGPFCPYTVYPWRCCPELEKYTLEEYDLSKNEITCRYRGLRLPCIYNAEEGKCLDGGLKCAPKAEVRPNKRDGMCVEDEDEESSGGESGDQLDNNFTQEILQIY